MILDMEQRVLQWLTFGCHQFGARTAARVQLQTEVQRLEDLQAQEEDHQSRIVVLMERARSEWELDTSVSTKSIFIKLQRSRVYMVYFPESGVWERSLFTTGGGGNKKITCTDI